MGGPRRQAYELLINGSIGMTNIDRLAYNLSHKVEYRYAKSAASLFGVTGPLVGGNSKLD